MSEIERGAAARAGLFLRRAAQVFPNLTVETMPEQGRSSIKEVHAAECQIVRLRVPEGVVDLSGRRAVEDRMGQYVKLVWQLRGESHLSGRAVDVTIASGEAAVLPLSQSYHFEATAEHDALLLVFDAARRPEWRALAHLWPPSAKKIDSAASAARAGIGSLMRHADHGRGDSIAVEACLDLMARFLTDGGDRSMPAWSGHPRLRKATLLVEHKMSDRHFGPDQLAKALGRSRRSLYEDFGELGTTPAEFIRILRLQRAKEEVSATREEGVSLTEIALRCGFADSASFSHAFKKAFGVTPSALKACARDLPGPETRHPLIDGRKALPSARMPF